MTVHLVAEGETDPERWEKNLDWHVIRVHNILDRTDPWSWYAVLKREFAAISRAESNLEALRGQTEPTEDWVLVRLCDGDIGEECSKPAKHKYEGNGEGPDGWLCHEHDARIMGAVVDNNYGVDEDEQEEG